ncbi:hypothetical protein GIB67_027234 [Kingdonia uniflora]|uniref:Man1/Src1-like C-terminal domain-containing protein n=1 Tax=Kingdonia uniflora TaxID=39325 RepID=A0A7J7KYB0_9MAGN|nr:hypothetical protein GIB67_027234 [Kingdonia uniflora]
MPSNHKKRPKSKHNKNSNPSFTLPKSLTKGPPSGLFPSEEDLFKLLGIIAIAVSVSFACNYTAKILNQNPKPFCDSGEFEDNSLSDICVPCPNNGKCSEGNLECSRGYQKQGKSCIEDGEINQTAKKLSEWVELRVCEAYVHYLCDNIGTVWVPEDDIWKELDDLKLRDNFGLKNDYDVYTKEKAMETVESSLESQTNIYGIKELKCPDWLAEHYKPLSCYIRQWVSEHALVLLPISLLLVGFTASLMLLRSKIRRRHYLSTRTELLYNQVCDILEEHAMRAKSVNGEGESWVVASQLRDHLLLPRERKDSVLWKKGDPGHNFSPFARVIPGRVRASPSQMPCMPGFILVEELVLEDSRLDQYPKLVKGESKVVWEWQGKVTVKMSSERNGLFSRLWKGFPDSHHDLEITRKFACI